MRKLAIIIIVLALTGLAAAQDLLGNQSKPGSIMGTVLDTNGDVVSGAKVVLKGRDPHDERTEVTNENGFFQFQNVSPNAAYQVGVSADDFSAWTSSSIVLDPGQFKILAGIQLRVATERTEIQVHYDPVEVATEQFRAEQKQRVFGIIPNFYVAYDPDPEPLTALRKFELALKVSTDPVTAAGVFFIASAKQAGDTPKYGQGWGAFGDRLGATTADGFTDIMIGGAILPSLLHQDPRYFYQGTGTTSSRIRHAIASPFYTRNDNGSWGPNYSTVGGVLASAALANLYYPRANRGAGLVFGNFAIGMAERVGAALAQEFVVARFTHRSNLADSSSY